MWAPAELADRLACELIDRAGVQHEAPIPIEDVAVRLGASVVPRQIHQEGRLICHRSGATIIVASDQPPARRRFTVAHELAHWALRSPTLCSPLALRAKNAFKSEEVFCNTVAGALLLPRQWTVATFPEAADESQQSLALVYRIARSANVSLSATVVRLRDLCGWRRTLLHWTRERDQWIFDSEAGVMPFEQGLIIPGDSAAHALAGAAAEAAAGGPTVQQWPLPLMIGNSDEDVWAEVSANRAGAVALIELPTYVTHDLDTKITY
jgi:Zn-dependent peptidase ImmA (M78 family)